MLYYLSNYQDQFSPLRVFQYITVRTFAAAGTAFVLSLILGPLVIRLLTRLKLGQVVRSASQTVDAPAHEHKQGTPTMGGILIVASILISSWLWALPTSLYVRLALATMCFMASIGIWDDYAKIRERSSAGLSGRVKLLLEVLWAATVACVLMIDPETSEHARQLMVPFLKEPLIADMGVAGTIFFAALVLAAFRPPDLVSPLRSIANSLQSLAGKEQ
jgi:phospho-N-acetylmuramoyl-pentapeptide-transferase